MLKFELNQKVKDSVTGFEGVITARVEYAHEIPQYLVEGPKNEKWVAEVRLEAV